MKRFSSFISLFYFIERSLQSEINSVILSSQQRINQLSKRWSLNKRIHQDVDTKEEELSCQNHELKTRL